VHEKSRLELTIKVAKTKFTLSMYETGRHKRLPSSHDLFVYPDMMCTTWRGNARGKRRA